MASKLVNAVIGSTQSKYAAFSISLTILILCIAILLMESDESIWKRLVAIFFILLMAVPGIVLTLIEITCVVTGGNMDGKNWWCPVLAWVISIFIILYCVMILITLLNSQTTYSDAHKKVKQHEAKKVMSSNEANNYAENILNTTRPGQPTLRPGQPTPRPAQPTPRPGQPTPRPAQPTPRPAQPTPRPAQPTPRPGQPTPRPAQPTPRPAQPTPRPGQPTPRPAQPTPRPVQPTPRPAQPTPRPAQPTPRPAQPTPRPQSHVMQNMNVSQGQKNTSELLSNSNMMGGNYASYQ